MIDVLSARSRRGSEQTCRCRVALIRDHCSREALVRSATQHSRAERSTSGHRQRHTAGATPAARPHETLSDRVIELEAAGGIEPPSTTMQAAAWTTRLHRPDARDRPSENGGSRPTAFCDGHSAPSTTVDPRAQQRQSRGSRQLHPSRTQYSECLLTPKRRDFRIAPSRSILGPEHQNTSHMRDQWQF